MNGLWAVRSGRFVGWRNGDILYNAEGDNVGYFVNDVVYSLHGEYLGEIFRDNWVGKRIGVLRPRVGGRVGYVGVALVPYVDRVGMAIAGWEDPDF